MYKMSRGCPVILARAVLGKGIMDVLGIVNIVDITDIADISMDIADIGTDIADITMGIVDVMDSADIVYWML